MANRIITSGGQVVSTVSGASGSNNSKPVVVNTSQLGGGVRQQMVVSSQAPSVRTVQFKPSSQAQSHNSSGVSGGCRVVRSVPFSSGREKLHSRIYSDGDKLLGYLYS